MNFQSKFSRLPLLISAFFGISACSGLSVTQSLDKDVLPPVMQSQILSMSGDIVPDYVQAGQGSSLSLTDARYVFGDQSLQWDWTANSTLVFRQPIQLVTDMEARRAWGRAATQVLSFWVYNEVPVDDYMVVDLGRGLSGASNADAGFKVNMNFSGWRTIGVSLQNDIQGYEVEGLGITDNAVGEGLGLSSLPGGPRNDMDSIRFTAPSKAKEGTFYIDRVMLSVDDARYQWSDDQVQTRYDIPEIDFGLPAQLPVAQQDEIAAAESIRESLVNVFVGSQRLKGIKAFDSLETLRENYDTLRIKRNENGALSGRHIITGKQKVIYQPEFMKEADKALFADYVSLSEYSNILFNIGQFWHNTADVEVKRELAEMYVMMTEHLLDQGFADGSGLVTTHHWGYSARWWYISAMLMTDALADAQLRQPVFDALLWYSREFKANFDMISGPLSSDLDYFNTLSRQHLALLMLEPDVDRRVALLKKFGSYINIALSQTPPGGYDGLRPDGTAWRHEGNYPGYSFPAFNNAAQLVYMLHGTPFSVSSEGRASLKKAMMSAWIYSNPEVGLGLSGRHPFNPPAVTHLDESYRWLALTGNPETGEKIDKELAAAYLQITDKSQSDSVELFGEVVSPADLPQGYWAFNGGAFGIHRYQDNMVTMKAYNSNVWSSEIYYRDNRYGRYQSHGAVQVVPFGKQADIGFSEDGWDWNRNPGATTIHLPLEQLDSPNSHTLMLRGEQPFSGASSLDGQFGMFAFKLNAPSMPRFDSSFTARKSAFSVRDRIVMLGTDISNSTTDNATETTLFQHGITEEANTIWVNGKPLNEFPFKAQLGMGDWLMDGHGSGYLITSDVTVEVRLQHQLSANNKTRKPTEGNFAVAWVDHGKAPSGAGYEYLLVLDATPEKMHSLAKSYAESGEKPYTVLRDDSQAHVVQDIQSNVTAYAVFDSGSFDGGVVTQISQPAIVMVRELANGQLQVSGGTPDLNMTRYTEAKPTTVSVTLAGKWQPVTHNEKVVVKEGKDTTELTYEVYFGMAQELILQPKQ